MSQLVALFDMDDTLCDTTGQTNRDLTKIFNDGREIITDYTSERCPIYMRKEIRKIRSQPGWWENLPKLDDGFQLYNLIKSEGLEIEILTKMPETYPLALWEKLQWCKKNIPGINNINLTLNKKRYPADILVDDWPRYVTTWLEYNKNGRAILPLREWNKDYLAPRAIHYTGQNIEQIKTLLTELKQVKSL